MTANIEASPVMSGLIDYCERCAPGFAGLLRPSSPGDVEDVISLIGLPLPVEYRSFLLAFGRSDPLTLAPFMADIEFGCDAIEDFYRAPPVPVPSDAAYLWTASGDCEMFLGVAGEWAVDHPVVSFSWPVDDATGKFLSHDRLPFIVSCSLPAFLYREAYSKLRVRNLAYHYSLRENVAPGAERTESAAAERGRRFVAVMENLGLRPLPFLDPNVLIYDRADVAVSMFVSVIAEDALHVDASDAREASLVTEILCDNLGARRFG